MTLDKLPIGESGVITQVGGEGALRCRLLDMGLIPRTQVTVRKAAPMGDPIEIRIRGYELTLRLDDAANISIEPAEDLPATDVVDDEKTQNKKSDEKKPSLLKRIFKKNKKDDNKSNLRLPAIRTAEKPRCLTH